MGELKHSNTTNENKINDLLKSTKAKHERIVQLEHRVNDLEQHSRKRNVIVTGLNMHSYSHTATRSTSARTYTQMNDGDDISESTSMRKNFVHDLPKRKDGTTPLIVNFVSTKKTELMRKRKMLKGSNVYLNDHLTQKNNELFAEARRLTYYHILL